jgi:hypothetical protein
MISENSTEDQRIKGLLLNLLQKDSDWVDVRDDRSFSRYTDYGDRHDEAAYSLYSEGRGMASDIRSILNDAFDPHVTHSYTGYSRKLAEFIKSSGEYYLERHAFHRSYTSQKKSKGAPIGHSVEAALKMWDEQVQILNSLQALLNIILASETYMKENQTNGNPAKNNITFNGPANVQIGNKNTQKIDQKFTSTSNNSTVKATDGATKEPWYKRPIGIVFLSISAALIVALVKMQWPNIFK